MPVWKAIPVTAGWNLDFGRFWNVGLPARDWVLKGGYAMER
jgi:hypothetical protein